jgi:alkanesulfonate monooxygenase SsuD/methylene tetrahydromethanopterin reductase-like flavin-dependent oxidoreductase (luciferase family)
MRVGLDLPNFGPLATADAVRRLAVAAEVWDGLFIWDHLCPLDGATEVADVWSLLRAAADANERLLVGPMIAPLGRLEPEYVAERALGLEAAVGPRVIVGIGRGVEQDLRISGDVLSTRDMHERVEERAAVLRRALREAGSRIQLWTSGFWPRTTGFAGAREADGIFPIAKGPRRGYGPPPPHEVAAVRAQLSSGAAVAFTGWTTASGAAPLDDYAAAGLDWWMEDLSRVPLVDALALAERGPGASVLPL